MLSNPTVKWNGFRPGVYYLDMKVLDFPLTRKVNGNVETPCTIGSIYESLKDKQITPESFGGGTSSITELTTTGGEQLVVGGEYFYRQILEEMLQLREEKVNPFQARWYWYQKTICLVDPDNSYSFFVVFGNKIVRERVTFFESIQGAFDPLVFQGADDSPPTWSDEKSRQEAMTKYWYRKFYSDTFTGKLLVLGSDSELFYYERNGSDVLGALGIIIRSLNTVRILLWVLVTLALLSFIRWK